MNKKLPTNCPSCNARLKVKSLYCESCETQVSGIYEMPVLLNLPQKEQDFVLEFVKCSGSLKVMAQNMKLSYPTVRNLLNEIIEHISEIESTNQPNEQTS